MRVAFDEQIFVLQRRGGISRSFIELIRALNLIPDVHALPPRGPVANAAAAREWRLNSVGRRGSRLLAAARRRRPSAPAVADLMHSTFYDPAWLPKGSSAPFVVTVHDMIPELLPDRTDPGAHLAKRDYVQRADLILVNSECTRRDLIEVYGTPTAPMAVTPFGVAPGFFEQRASAPGLPNPYVVFVGHRGGYKAFETAVLALTELPRDLHLVAVGGGRWTSSELERQRHLGVTSRVHRVDVGDDAGLSAVYRAAVAAVVPSEYEGFGLPVLEAMASGTAVVTSDGGALPEVGGDAALTFPVGDHTELAARIRRLLEDPRDRAQKQDAGQRRAADFTWSRTADLTIGAYRSVLD